MARLVLVSDARTWPVTVGPASGFGLYMAARMATLNGGQLVYEPAETGACFALTLPVSAAEG